MVYGRVAVDKVLPSGTFFNCLLRLTLGFCEPDQIRWFPGISTGECRARGLHREQFKLIPYTGHMLATLWIFFAMFINIFYNVEFRSSLISPGFESPINTFEDVDVQEAAMFYATVGDQDVQFAQTIPIDIYHNVLFAGYTNLYSHCISQDYYGNKIDWTNPNEKELAYNYLIDCKGSIIMKEEDFNSYAIERMSGKTTHHLNFLLRHSTIDPINVSMKHLNIIMNDQRMADADAVVVSFLQVLQTGIVGYFSHTPLYYDVTQNPNAPEFGGDLSLIRIEYLQMSFNAFFILTFLAMGIFLLESGFVNARRAHKYLAPILMHKMKTMVKYFLKHLGKLRMKIIYVSMVLLSIFLALMLLGFITVTILEMVGKSQDEPHFG